MSPRSRPLPTFGEFHTVHDLGELGLPEVPLLGIHSQPRAARGLASHTHRGAMEICYLVRGEMVFHVGGTDHRMSGHDIFWTHPDEEHSSGRNQYDKSLLYWTQIRLPTKPAPFLCLGQEQAWPLIQGLRSLPLRVFPGPSRLRELFEEAFLFCQAPPSPLQRLGLALRMAEWLRTVVESARLRAVPTHSEDIQAALRSIRKGPPGALTMRQLAATAHLSESRFKAKFREQVGMPPGEYLLRARIEEGRRLLRETSLSVTQIARQLNFSSSQYFAQVFRRFTHQRPSDLRERRP